MRLGQQQKDHESIQTEYKEFCLKLNIFDFYEMDEVYHIVTTGKLNSDFNLIIEQNLKSYFFNYIPKYASAFSNCKSNNECSLYIGVNDFGEVTGIPYVGELDIAELQIHINQSFNHIRGEFKEDYINAISLDIIKLDTTNAQTFLYDVSAEIIDKMKQEKSKYDTAYINYIHKREKWMCHFNKYCCSIHQLIAGKRHEIINYIKRIAPHRQNIIQRLNDRTPIPIENIEACKDNEDEPLYWIFKFKDEVLERILSQKPRPPILPKICNAPYILITQLSDMRCKFLKENKDLNYYLINIKFSAKMENKKHLEYYHPYKRVWLNRKRVMHPIFGACCIAI